ncbi:MAG: alpha/beta hydrolase [Parasporobacterium sp.]|nr:alpha/beta hydrolase [Parasporobacterium sp.]
MKLEKIYLYDDRTDVYLDAILPDFDPGVFSRDKSPAMIVVPGGGFITCDAGGEGEPAAIEFANAGYKAFVLHYSAAMTAGEYGCRFPVTLLELGKAVLKIRERAEEWNIDTDRICLTGFSAGGNVVGLYATRWHEEFVSEALGADSKDLKPFAAVLIYSLLDYKSQFEYEQKWITNPMIGGTVAYLGSAEPDEETLKQASPCYHVTRKTVPIFMVQASDDKIVQTFNSLNMAAALSKKRVPYELHMFSKGGHGFGIGQEMGESFHKLNRRLQANHWVEMAEEWLLKLMIPEIQDRVLTDPGFFDNKNMDIPPFAQMMGVQADK